MEKLPVDFYTRSNVLAVAKDLLGKLLVTNLDNKITSGRIVEVEAYNGIVDKASHAFGNRRTARTEIMYAEGGVAYVYLCYGIHYLFNVVTNTKDIPHAILIRALEPVDGISTMLKRTNKKVADHTLTKGPGNLSKALGISILQNGFSLTSNEIYLADDGKEFLKKEIIASQRIGVDYAGKDAALPYRFYKKGNAYVSGKSK